MTRFTNGLEGIATGAVITPANSGGVSGNAFSAVVGSPTVVDTRAAHGTKSMRMATGTSIDNVYWTSTVTGGSPNISARCSICLLGNSTVAGVAFMRGYGQTGIAWTAELTATNTLRLRQVSSQIVGTFTIPLALNQFYRVEVRSTRDSAAANIGFAYYLGDSLTPAETIITSTTGNTGGSDFSSARFGALSTTERTADILLDDLAFDDAAAGTFFGPAVTYSSAVPTVLNAATNWTASAGDILSCIANQSLSDWAETAVSGSVIDLTFGPLTAPAAGIDFVVQVPMDKSNLSTGQLVGRLYDGSTLRATAAAVSIPNSVDILAVRFAAADITAVTSWSTGVRVTLTPTFS